MYLINEEVVCTQPDHSNDVSNFTNMHIDHESEDELATEMYIKTEQIDLSDPILAANEFLKKSNKISKKSKPPIMYGKF